MPLADIRRELALEKNVVVMGMTSMVATFGNTLWYFFLPYYYSDLHASPTTIGSIYAAWLAITALGSTPGGALADRFGRKNVVVLSSVISTAAVFMLALSYLYLSNQFWISAIAFPISGLGSALFQSSRTLIAESVEKERRGTAFGTFMTLEQSLAVFSPTIGGYLVSKAGYFPLFFIGAVLTSSAIVPRFILLSETLPQLERKSISEENPSRLLSRFKAITTNKFLLTLVLAYSLYNLLVDQNSYITPLYADQVLHLPHFEAGLLFSVLLCVLAFTRLPAGKLADKIGRKKTVIVSWIGEISVVYIFVFAGGSLPLALIGIALWQFFGVIDSPAISAWVAESSDARNRGLSMGTFNTVAYLATVPALAASGFLFGVDPQLPFYLNSLLGIFSLALLIKFTKKD